MDAAVRLALMAKAKAVFESDGTFLTFPALNPLSFTREWFDLALGHGMTNPELQAAAEFSHIVNSIPTGMLFDGTSEEFLWNVYDDVLERAHVASVTLTADEQAARQKAIALLYLVGSDGTRSDSPQLRAYRQYRDAVITVEEELRNAQATAEAAGDEALAAWQAGPGVTLRTQLESAEQDWATKGFKDEVDQALHVEETLAQKGASGQWTDWRNAFDPKIDLVTNPSDSQSFGPTGLVPSDAITLQSWPTFTLSDDEIRTLVNKAPAELKNLLRPGVQPADVDVVSMTFEYRSAALNRPWFNPKVFRCRCWKFDTGEQQLSDGGNPPTGRCPAYVAALVLARNINVTSRQPDGGFRRVNLAYIPALQATEMARLDAIVRGRRVLEANPAVLGAVGRPPVAESPTKGRTVDHRFGGSPAIVAVPASPPPAPPPAAQIQRAAMMRLAGANFRAATGIAKAPSPAPVVTTTGNQISVLALICRTLPKAPDPDPALSW